jgi:hypothetical protein
MMMLSQFRRRPDGIMPRHILALEYPEPSGLGGDSVISSSVKSATDRPDIALTILKLERFWLPSMIGMSWRQRLELLEAIDQELAATYPHGGVSQHISRHLILKAIENVQGGDITCLEQAILYFNSDRAAHRRAAQVWLVVHRPDIVASLAPPAAERRKAGDRASDQRHARRYAEEMAVTVTHQDRLIDGALLDLSSSGGRIALRPTAQKEMAPKDATPIEPPLPRGAIITVSMAFLAPQPARIVWTASRWTGISFLPK